jgi:endonuclease YncB( thermonuclease family)
MARQCGEPTTSNRPCQNAAGMGRAAEFGPCYLHVDPDTPDRTHIESIDEFVPFVYRGYLVNVVDGDTFDVFCDLGYQVFHEVRIRPLDIDAAELFSGSSTARERGAEHRDWASAWFTDAHANHDGDWPLVIDTRRDQTGAFGRYLAYIYRKSDGAELTADFIAEYGDDVRY